ncbi:hypothetical protein [Hwangdonia lutea]|uniref:Uncharacterized protein n=1 Tax=Hwangdonia lutea TaxID=3075823 RepID=A0AA97EK87_9FLAO|nr:hypothetical protein [Hwangdonia sp. SCSIO 19198]WOD42986.1 hypothetical protein RNZ46_13405 [Hwangdonia sp. SCSIO 19198]
MLNITFVAMKKVVYIFAFVLSILLLFNNAKVSLTFAYYNIDPIGFIDALCENKDKPELECNGKCQLEKVAKSQDKEQKTPISVIDFKELILFSHVAETMVLSEISGFKVQQPTRYQNLYSFNNTNDCFHPPRA